MELGHQSDHIHLLPYGMQYVYIVLPGSKLLQNVLYLGQTWVKGHKIRSPVLVFPFPLV